MEDVNISIYRASVVREGSTPASPGFVVSEGQNPVDPSGSGQNHLPVTIATAATGLSITESQVLGGAGTVGQYIRGDGSLADFPESSGGGSSVSYYLNGSVAQGTIGGVAYKELNKVPILGAGTDFTINADGYIASFLTDAGDPNLLEIPGGNWNFETYFSSSSSGGTPSFYVELYKYDGSTFTLLASNSGFPEFIAFGTIITPYFSTLAVPTTTLALTDRLAIRYYVTHSGRTITLHTEDNHLCQIVTTFTTGITALNGLTAQVQNFATGTSGTDFAIASATATHTFNLPTASATNRGALSSSDWTTFNNKTSNLGTVTSVGLSSATSGVTIGSSPVTTSGTITLAIATASGSQNGLLSSTDWTTFNGKQNALTNPVTGTGSTNYLPKFTGASTIGNSLFTDNGTNGAFGGANYYAGTDLRTFNISAPLYAGLAFWANNQSVGSIIGFGVTGNLILNADQSNLFANTKIILSIDDTERFAVFSNGNVSIANSPTDNGAKFQVSGTATISGDLGVGRIPSSGYKVDIQGNGGLRILDNDVLRSITITPPVSGTKGIIATASGEGISLQSTNASGFVTIETAGSEQIRVSSVGTSTFNTTSAINAVFDSTNASGGYIGFRRSNTSIGYLGNSAQLGIGTLNALELRADNNLFLTTTSGTLSMLSTGNVGIGVSTPQSKLHIDGVLTFTEFGFPTVRLNQIQSSHSDGSSPNNNLRFLVSNGSGSTSERMRLNGNGNLLLATTTDIGERLTLNGRIGIVGATVASGNYRSFFVRGSQNVADGGTLSINITNTALIFIAENNTGTGALFFLGYASGTITKISDPSNMFDVADTAGKLCIFKSAVSDVATIKNRLGSTKNITVSFIGVSD